MATDMERFLACMEYKPGVQRPNHELGTWKLTMAQWKQEAPEAVKDFTWGWFQGEKALGMDHREFVPVDCGFVPPFPIEVVQVTDDYEIKRNAKGILTKALRAGTVDGQRMSMDEYMDFPVKTRADFAAIKKRLVPGNPKRYSPKLDQQIEQWKKRDFPLCLGRNCQVNGFYWRARELMGTEGLSYGWYDQPELMHEMMEFLGDFFIETLRPVVEKIRCDYFTFNEDCAMKAGPLLSPSTFREFIFPHLKRVIEFLRGKGIPYIAVDCDGAPTALIPQWLEAGVDTTWPIERASDISPMGWRKRFGRALRLWGGVDKRVLTRGPKAIREHLREFIPLIEEGGFIPTVDHLVPPDVTWDNFRHYMDAKRALLAGEFAKLA